MIHDHTIDLSRKFCPLSISALQKIPYFLLEVNRREYLPWASVPFLIYLIRQQKRLSHRLI